MEQNQPQQQPDSSVSPVPKPENQSKAGSIFFRRFLIGMFTFYLLFGLTVLTVWIIIRPVVPVFELDHASVSNITIIHNSTRSHEISGANWELLFQVSNPNSKIKIRYHNITSSIYYQGALLARTPLPPFDQETRGETSISASFSGSMVGEVRVVSEGSSVYFHVEVTGNVAFGLGGWRPRRRSLTVECEDVMFDIPANDASGKMAGEPQVCSVEF